MYREADGPDGMPQRGARADPAGGRLVKVMTTGALTVPDEDVNPAQLTDEELAALVDESHRQGSRVASHAEGVDGIRAVRRGRRWTRSSTARWAFEGPDVLAAMAERGIVLVPTLCVFDVVADPSGGFARVDAGAGRTPRRVRREDGRRGPQRRRRDGDGRGRRPARRERPRAGAARRGRAHERRTRSSPAPRIAADACGLGDEIGTIAAGKAADLLVVDGDPLEDVSVLCDPARRWLVMKDGRPVAGTALGRVQSALGEGA